MFRILEFYFNARQGNNPMNPVNFKQEQAVIDFQVHKPPSCLSIYLERDHSVHRGANGVKSGIYIYIFLGDDSAEGAHGRPTDHVLLTPC